MIYSGHNHRLVYHWNGGLSFFPSVDLQHGKELLGSCARLDKVNNFGFIKTYPLLAQLLGVLIVVGNLAIECLNREVVYFGSPCFINASREPVLRTKIVQKTKL
jgi:hypothetical protein